MKKTYISPKSLIVQMRPFSAILQASMIINNDTNNALGDGEILVKGNVISDVNVWDSEW